VTSGFCSAGFAGVSAAGGGAVGVGAGGGAEGRCSITTVTGGSSTERGSSSRVLGDVVTRVLKRLKFFLIVAEFAIKTAMITITNISQKITRA
jgi:hypothetical protein